MNEGYILQNQTSIPEADPVMSPAADLDVSNFSGNEVSFIPGSSAYDLLGLVSGGDLEAVFPDQAISQGSIAIQDIYSDPTPYLERIDYKLSAILAFLLFSWCFKRIRSGVKGFTGRGLDE